MLAFSWAWIFSSRVIEARFSICSADRGGSVNAFARRLACQPGVSVAAHSGSVSQSSRTSMDDGVRWKMYSSFDISPRWGTACTAVAPVPMMPTTLSPSFSRFEPV